MTPARALAGWERSTEVSRPLGCPVLGFRAPCVLADDELPLLLPHQLEHVDVPHLKMITHVGNLRPFWVSGVLLARHDAAGAHPRYRDYKWISRASVPLRIDQPWEDR